MNDFELRLESDLRRLLNPILAAPAPARRQRHTDDAKPAQPRPFLAIVAVTPDAAF
jgi:hypothetical protein